MAVSITNPKAPTLPQATGFDAEIQRLQLLLASKLKWLAVSYGKAYRASRREGGTGKGKLLYYPQVYDGGRDYRDVLANDNVQAQSFFYPTGPAVNPAREWLPNSLGFTMPVDLIVWADLMKVDSTKEYRYEAELLQDVLRVLNADGAALVGRVFTAYEDVFRGFSLDVVPEKVLKAPYAGFRISLELALTDVLCRPPKVEV
jgi:hypothetical protein